VLELHIDLDHQARALAQGDWAGIQRDQIEATALRELRLPGRSKKLKDDME